MQTNNIPGNPGLRDVQPYNPTVLYHYSDKTGYDAILKSQILKASVIEGLQSTHYGKGVYFTDIGPKGLDGYGHVEAIQRIYADVSINAVSKMQYYLEISVDPAWTLGMARCSPEGTNYGRWLNTFVVPGTADLSIAGRVTSHGPTSIKAACDKLPQNDKTPAQNYAYQLRQQFAEFKAEEEKQSKAYNGDPKYKPAEFVFIDGKTVKRPPGWEEDLHRFPKTYD